MAVTAILIALVMTVLDVTVVNVALPVLSGELGVSNSWRYNCHGCVRCGEPADWRC